MKRSLRFFMLLGLAPLMALPATFGQGPGNRLYNPATVTTVQGTIKQVSIIGGGQGRFYGTLLKLKTNAGKKLQVRLGPQAYVLGKGFSFAKGKKIEVTGSQIVYKGKPVIIAREVKMDGKTLVLRDEQGFPAWTGGRFAEGSK